MTNDLFLRLRSSLWPRTFLLHIFRANWQSMPIGSVLGAEEDGFCPPVTRNAAGGEGRYFVRGETSNFFLVLSEEADQWRRCGGSCKNESQRELLGGWRRDKITVLVLFDIIPSWLGS